MATRLSPVAQRCRSVRGTARNRGPPHTRLVRARQAHRSKSGDLRPQISVRELGGWWVPKPTSHDWVYLTPTPRAGGTPLRGAGVASPYGGKQLRQIVGNRHLLSQSRAGRGTSVPMVQVDPLTRVQARTSAVTVV
jgi:hypothetical protein